MPAAEALGKKYVEKYFPQRESAVRDMVGNLLLQCRPIEGLTWNGARN